MTDQGTKTLEEKSILVACPNVSVLDRHTSHVLLLATRVVGQRSTKVKERGRPDELKDPAHTLAQ